MSHLKRILDAKARSKVMKSMNDACVVNNNHTHSTSGPKTIETKELIDLVQHPTTTCTNTESPHPTISVLTALMDDLSLAAENEMVNVPHPTISVLTALMDDLSLAAENEMVNVPLVPDDESDDGWSVISEEDDFVVIDSAETPHHQSSKSKKESEAPRRSSKQARPSTPDPRQKGIVICQNDREEPEMMLAIQNGGEKQVRHRQ